MKPKEVLVDTETSKVDTRVTIAVPVPIVDKSQGLCVTGKKSDHLLEAWVKEKMKSEVELKRRENELAEKKKQLKECDDKIMQLQKERVRIEQENSDEIDKRDHQIKEAKEERDKAEERCEILLDKVQILTTNLSELTEKMKQLKRETEAECAQMHSRLQKLKDDNEYEREQQLQRDKRIDEKLAEILASVHGYDLNCNNNVSSSAKGSGNVK